MSLALVLLGSSGQLGRRLEVGAGARVIGVSRSGSIACDVTLAASRESCAAAALAAAERSRIVVVDAVLDPRTVASMRDSLAGATSLGLEILDLAASEGRAAGAVLCGTTAVLAPRLLSTPYARFKHLQLDRYASSGHPFAGLLLPRLFAGTPPPGPGFALSFDAAGKLAGEEAAALAPTSRRLLVPGRDGDALSAPDRQGAGDALRGALRAGPLTVRRWTSGRSSPLVHRHASRALLAALPHRVRAGVDHHLVPPSRVERLAGSIGAEIVQF